MEEQCEASSLEFQRAISELTNARVRARLVGGHESRACKLPTRSLAAQSQGKTIWENDLLISVVWQMLSMIPIARFENVCEELNNALKREQQAQGLLHEQTAQMQEMGERLELHANQGEEKDVTLAEAVKVAISDCCNWP